MKPFRVFNLWVMKKLEKEFIGRGEVRGFKFSQLKKNDHAFIYIVDDGSNKRFEVFERRINNKFNCESYPKSKSFGLWAWSYMSLHFALDKFDEITIRKESKNG